MSRNGLLQAEHGEHKKGIRMIIFYECTTLPAPNPITWLSGLISLNQIS
jgi:hypothetical protein